MSNFSILDDGDNISDHLPIIMELSIEFEPASQIPEKTQETSKLRWDKLNPCRIDDYTETLRVLVDANPRKLTQCVSACFCSEKTCLESIQNEYDLLVYCLQTADSALPRHKPGVSKDWWTDGLTELKNKSIDIHCIWKNAIPHVMTIHRVVGLHRQH